MRVNLIECYWFSVKIVDDDIGIRSLGKTHESDEEDIYFGTKEEKPEVADVIDDRPLALRNNDKDAKGMWKRICEDDEEDDDAETSRKRRKRRRSYAELDFSDEGRVRRGCSMYGSYNASGSEWDPYAE